jgi:hypothetical protein
VRLQCQGIAIRQLGFSEGDSWFHARLRLALRDESY